MRRTYRALRPHLRLSRRWTVIAGVVVLGLGGGTTAWAMTRSSASGTSSSQVVAAKIATINQSVSSSGTIAAAKVADLNFGANGRVTDVKVVAGDKVTKGQTLATVGAASLRAADDAAKATLTSAEDAVAESSSGGSSTAVTAAHSALVAARSQLKTANATLAAAHLRATITGTVTSIGLTKGQAVTASTVGGSDSSQVVISSSKTFIVNATVDDTEVKSVKKGQTVAITPDGATSSVAGTVKSISSIPATSSSVVSFPIVITVNGHPSGVYSGATATTVITTKHVDNVLEIPTLAIAYSGSTASVKVRLGSSTTTRTITVGTSYGLETQVLSGLKSGERVVVTIPTFQGGPASGGNGGEGPSLSNFPGGSTPDGSGGGTFPSGTGPGAFSGGQGG